MGDYPPVTGFDLIAVHGFGGLSGLHQASLEVMLVAAIF